MMRIAYAVVRESRNVFTGSGQLPSLHTVNEVGVKLTVQYGRHPMQLEWKVNPVSYLRLRGIQRTAYLQPEIWGIDPPLALL